MTLGEVTRAIKSKMRVKKVEAQERATFDYILADLVGLSVGRFIAKELDYPTLEEVYPSLFTEQAKSRKEAQAAKATELSIIRLKQYANFHNEKYNKEVAQTE